MKKNKKFVFLFLFFLFLSPLSLFALDPVAPVAERKFGTLFVKSPMPESDSCVVQSNTSDFSKTFKSGETIKLPVGEYSLKVKLQDAEWNSLASIQPTERTEIVVIGYGNLKVKSPNPSADRVEVYTPDARLVKSFSASKTQTLPTGEYTVKIKLGKSELIQSGVTLISNTTRELEVGY